MGAQNIRISRAGYLDCYSEIKIKSSCFNFIAIVK